MIPIISSCAMSSSRVEGRYFSTHGNSEDVPFVDTDPWCGVAFVSSAEAAITYEAYIHDA